MSARVTSECIGDWAAFAALEAEWWALWNRVPSSTPFQSPAWLLPWWRAFAPGDLTALAVRHGSRLVALAPCYVETGPRGRRALPIGISLTDYHDVLLDPEFESAAAAALARAITETYWDEWEFPELAPGAQALQLQLPSECAELIEPACACPVLRLPGAIDDFRRAYPPRKRRSLRLVHNRAARRGRFEVARANGDSALEFFELLVRLHRARWAACGQSGVLADPSVQTFHREAIPRLMQASLVRLYALRIAGDTAAVYYGFFHRNRAYGYLTGFDPDYQYESPGTILLDYAIEQAGKEGALEFHFLRGREPYKYGWGAVDRWNQRRAFSRVSAYACAS
jgi:CelD/BcsL family acetyltransferase involved in cellulose biosynthesis